MENTEEYMANQHTMCTCETLSIANSLVYYFGGRLFYRKKGERDVKAGLCR